MLGTGYFLKTAKINSQREKPMCPIVAKISFSETEKNPNRKNKLPQQFRATRYLHLDPWVGVVSGMGMPD